MQILFLAPTSGSLQLPVTSVPGHRMLSSGLSKHLHTCGGAYDTHTHTEQIYIHTLTEKVPHTHNIICTTKKENIAALYKLNDLKHAHALLLHTYLYLVCVYTRVYVWNSQNDLQNSLLSFHHEGPGPQTQVRRGVRALPTEPSCHPLDALFMILYFWYSRDKDTNQAS